MAVPRTSRRSSRRTTQPGTPCTTPRASYSGPSSPASSATGT